MNDDRHIGAGKRQREIDRLVERLRPSLADPTTFDILINPPNHDGEACSVWVDSADGGLRPTGIKLQQIDVMNLNRSIGNELGRTIDENNPISAMTKNCVGKGVHNGSESVVSFPG